MEIGFLLLSWFVWLVLVCYFYPRIWCWASGAAVSWGCFYGWGHLALPTAISTGSVLIVIVVLMFAPIRRQWLTRPLFTLIRPHMPKISETEKEALVAGDSWWESEVFNGRPNWKKLHFLNITQLTDAEEAFLENDVSQLCAGIDDWDVTHHQFDLSKETWDTLRNDGFFGLVLDKTYGGYGFSAAAHSRVISKISTRSITAAVTTMVPNSLGPGELITHYGTDEQKSNYLPKLASGELIPCFGLTGPFAGSDATSIPDKGIVCKKDGVLGISITCDKRYITLAPVATLIGLAFQLYDPEHFLGDKDHIGITIVLLPRETPGLEIGKRAVPLNIPFMNGTIHSKDMFVPIDGVLGGEKMIGRGWQMLVECLSIGRSISLPALSVSTTSVCELTTGAYAHVREQFRSPIGRFEGVQMPLGEIVGICYLVNATAELTYSAVDQGLKPSVASAIAKYHTTELGRIALNHAMDIHGGKGIILGPRNYLGRAYQGNPVSITVEGANILTRSLIIFGQGAMRAHPYVLKEFEAAQNPDRRAGLKNFDATLFAHLGYLSRNKIRSYFYGITGGRLIFAPRSRVKKYYRRVTKLSSHLALFSDFVLARLGGALKRREALSGRLGDALSHLYMASAVLKHYHDKGEPKEEYDRVAWCLEHCTFKAQEALFAFARNSGFWMARCIRRICFPLGRVYGPPTDQLLQRLALSSQQPSKYREQLKKRCYIGPDGEDALSVLEQAFAYKHDAAMTYKRLREGLKSGELDVGMTLTERLDAALAQKMINQDEYNRILRAEQARWEAISTDAFDKYR